MKFQVKVENLITDKITVKSFSNAEDAIRYADNHCDKYIKITVDIKED